MPTYKIYKTVDNEGPTRLVAEPKSNEELISSLRKIQTEQADKFAIFAVERNDGNCVDYSFENGEFVVLQRYRGHGA